MEDERVNETSASTIHRALFINGAVSTIRKKAKHF